MLLVLLGYTKIYIKTITAPLLSDTAHHFSAYHLHVTLQHLSTLLFKAFFLNGTHHTRFCIPAPILFLMQALVRFEAIPLPI